MRCRLHSLAVDAHDPPALARFWAEVLGRTLADVDGRPTLLPEPGREFAITFHRTAVERTVPNQMHFDLTSDSAQAQAATVAAALALGATHLDVGQSGEEGHVVLADPEGNEFCVIEAGNSFLDGCGRIGALASDGSAAVGRFWSRALGWPLVWEVDEETAIQSPSGGTKITWGGPPLNDRPPRNRLRFDLVPVGSDQAAEVERLVSLGATLASGAAVASDPTRVADVGRIALLDPDGNEFGLLAG